MSCQPARVMQSLFVHLTAHQSLVRAGTDFLAVTAAAGWSFFRVCAGRGYLMTDPSPKEIAPGDLIVIPAAAKVSLRASQLGDMRLCHFGVCPEQLTGFFTAGEQRALNTLISNPRHLTRVIPQDDAVAREHAELCRLRLGDPGVLVRSAMLSVAVRALRDILTQVPNAPASARGAEEKLAALAARLPESELLRRSAGELARECGCSERHLRRLFVERFGASLLQRQIEWRIEQAKKLLLDTDAKIIDVAGQCGFRSLGQFNHIFKQLTRLSPGAWRTAFALTKARYGRRHPPLCPRLATHLRLAA